MDELTELIKEQEVDMLFGRKVWPEPGVVLSLDLEVGDNKDKLSEVLLVTFNSDEWMPVAGQRSHAVFREDGCTIHDNQDMTLTSAGRPVCNICRRAQQTRYRRARGQRPANRRPCLHGDEDRYRSADGHSRCRACQAEYNREYREAHRAELNEKQNAKRRTPGKRASQAEYMRAYRARKRKSEEGI